MTLCSLLTLLIVMSAISNPATSLFAQQRKAIPSYRITGIVVNARDHSPVRHCLLTARLSGGGRGGPRDPVTADTDEQGHFALALPSAGNWELTATAHNIRAQAFDSHEGYFTGIVLTAQSPSYDLVFEALLDATVTGTVTDEAGEPVRNAQVALFANDPAARQTGGTGLQQRQGTQTDDRGRYEMAGLDPGEYMVQVQARPWYAGAPAGSGRQATPTPSPDPSLDVVYPVTWYPGVADASAADILTAHPGDALQADFRLSPVPSAHLLIPSPAPPPTIAGRPEGPGFIPALQIPNISLLLPGGSLQQVFGQFSRGPNGDFDISGLAPGIYQIAYPGAGPDSPGRTSTVRIQSGGSSTDLSASIPESTVTIAVEGGTSVGASKIVLRDMATGQSFTSLGRQGGGRFPSPQGPGSMRQADPPPARGVQTGPRGRAGGGGQPWRGRPRPASDSEEVTLQVPSGRYDVMVRDDSAFVIGLTAKGASTIGRSIAIPETPVHLMVHLASGFATVSGTALLAGKPCAGAMVLLVPATLGDPAGLTLVRRDQTNSDGSFHLSEIIPGQYILLAIDHGWSVRWTDPETLRPYLMQGIPLDLRSSSTVNPRLTAIAP